MHVQEAHFKHDHEKLGKMDPYVKGDVRDGEQEFRTTCAKDQGKEPKWGREETDKKGHCNVWEISVKTEADQLKLHFLDEEVFKDKKIGWCNIKLNALINGVDNPYNDWFEIYEEGSNELAGKVRLDSHWTPAQ